MTSPESPQRQTLGKAKFAERLGLHTGERRAALETIKGQLSNQGIETVRIGFVDTHGLVRTRAIEATHFAQAAANGMAFTTAHLAMDSGNNIFLPVFSKGGGFGIDTMSGAGDMIAMPDLSTFRILPWSPKTGWVLSDLYLSDGARCPLDSRYLMQTACSRLAERDLDYLGGIEVECYVMRIDDAKTGFADSGQPPTPPSVSALRHGFQYMSDSVVDDLEPVTGEIRRALLGMGLPLRTVESEWGPGQIEITLDPLVNVAAADAMIMLRATVKQVCRRAGLLATFMTKPALPNAFPSGWHLHQSLAFKSGGNAFMAEDALLSPLGLQFMAGILAHVRAGSAFSNPTINGYKRLNANPLSPKRAVWSHDNKAAMCRLIGGPGETITHIENRSGEPMANPYLYMATQIFAGLEGIASKRDPGPPLDDPYAQTSMEPMPISLMEAVDALDKSTVFREAMGDRYVDYFLGVKRSEIMRFFSHVTDWEHREYFEAF
jgi:glutamine synthetase